jgi:Fic family protein
MPLYDHSSQFLPLLPDIQSREQALVKAHDLQKIALTIKGRAHGGVIASLSPLLRAMNSYYTNLIEGQHTRPSEIEQALRKDFSADNQLRRKQHIALAHIQTEKWAEALLGTQQWQALFSADSVQVLHRELFARMPEQYRVADDGTRFAPGEWRDVNVEVGRHVAPDHTAVQRFLQGWAQEYRQTRDGELAIVAAAASHHRLAWIHPFRDGNGRVARLHTHLLLHAMGLTNGVWSPMRGLARNKQQYYNFLAVADQPRAGDYDGRGNLSQRGLAQFIEYFLDICIDQARFMGQMLNFYAMKDRIAACLSYLNTTTDSDIRIEALNALHYTFMSGPIERGEFKRMLGLAPRTADRVVAALESRGLLWSETPKGKVTFGMPLHALRFYFPALWPEAEADVQRNAG